MVDPFTPDWMTVCKAQSEAPGVSTLDLVARDGTAMPEFLPGQFAMLYAFGIGEAAISNCEMDAQAGLSRFTVRAAGATTRALENMKPGDCIGLRGPFGTGWPVEEIAGQDLVLIGGGIGMAPLRSVLSDLLKRDIRPNRSVLIYGAQEPQHLLYRQEFAQWSDAGVEIHTIVDRATAEWSGEVGLVTHLIPRAEIDPENTTAFVCGPEVMMRFSAFALLDASLAPERIWLSIERNMKCAIGHCGHCQFGKDFVCKDGPVLRFDRIRERLLCKEI